MGTDEPIIIAVSNADLIGAIEAGFDFSITAESRTTTPKKTKDAIANPENACAVPIILSVSSSLGIIRLCVNKLWLTNKHNSPHDIAKVGLLNIAVQWRRRRSPKASPEAGYKASE